MKEPNGSEIIAVTKVNEFAEVSIGTEIIAGMQRMLLKLRKTILYSITFCSLVTQFASERAPVKALAKAGDKGLFEEFSMNWAMR